MDMVIATTVCCGDCDKSSPDKGGFKMPAGWLKCKDDENKGIVGLGRYHSAVYPHNCPGFWGKKGVVVK